jgi:hypothetical protein
VGCPPILPRGAPTLNNGLKRASGLVGCRGRLIDPAPHQPGHLLEGGDKRAWRITVAVVTVLTAPRPSEAPIVRHFRAGLDVRERSQPGRIASMSAPAASCQSPWADQQNV